MSPQKNNSSHDASAAAVLHAVDQFYSALNRLFVGDAQPMKDLWSHQADVTYMGPEGSFAKGWDQISEIWEFQANAMLGGKVDVSDIRLFVGDTIAVSYNCEKGENKNAAIGEQQVSIRASNVFRNESGVWKMIGHHTDLLPYLAKA